MGRKSNAATILASRRRSKRWLDQLAKHWMVPPNCQLKSLDLRSTETLLLPRRIPVPMSRVCFSFRRERSALTWANRAIPSANQPSSSRQSNFRSVSRVSVASVEKPYLAFFLKLDMGIVRDVLHTEEVRISAPPVGTRGMVLGEATVETACAMLTHGSALRHTAGCSVLWQAAPARNRLPTAAGAPGRSFTFDCNAGGPKLSNG